MKRKGLFWRAVFEVLVFHLLVLLFWAFAGTSGRICVSKSTKLLVRKKGRLWGAAALAAHVLVTKDLSPLQAPHFCQLYAAHL